MKISQLEIVRVGKLPGCRDEEEREEGPMLSCCEDSEHSEQRPREGGKLDVRGR
jgi:hypothetical protein